MVSSYVNEQQTIGVTQAQVLPARDRVGQLRTILIVSNQSAGGQKITLSIAKEAVAGAGIVLSPGGSWAPDTRIPQAQINAISDVAGALLSVFEEVLQ